MKMNLVIISIVMILKLINLTWLNRMLKWRQKTMIQYKPLLKKRKCYKQTKSNEFNKLKKAVSFFFLNIILMVWCYILKFLIKIIMGSSSWRHDLVQNTKGKNLIGLIDGYGIHWKI
ncbi:putative signal peptide protein [Puccinia sorghi]|uniref:Putative signal peptide protein n=1 Tax=Puccinia sorghi TaxID=27349 RepID=A0A0L6UKE8_9BASI|nr:putative signal peptide protein [Puccinia sorghi]